MSGQSKVGTSGVYEAGDQRNYKNSELGEEDRYNEGKPHSHNNLDSKDERSIANRLAATEKKVDEPENAEVAMSKRDPTLPAKMHGNEPSRGAQIDAELATEEAETLRKKGKGP